MAPRWIGDAVLGYDASELSFEQLLFCRRGISITFAPVEFDRHLFRCNNATLTLHIIIEHAANKISLVCYKKYLKRTTTRICYTLTYVSTCTIISNGIWLLKMSRATREACSIVRS